MHEVTAPCLRVPFKAEQPDAACVVLLQCCAVDETRRRRRAGTIPASSPSLQQPWTRARCSDEAQVATTREDNNGHIRY